MGARGSLMFVAAAAWAAACTPPEAKRVRGGGPGADPGNRDPVVEMHGGSNMYWETPCRTTVEAECPGPLPVAGVPERDRLLKQWGS